jgi:transcriptional regulator with XRE-family HTH domain
MSVMSNRVQLGDFLRRRREELSPAEVGLPPGRGRRRTPGLRRDEVSALANMSAGYYEHLEQGRGPLPSATVLAAMADALRLTAAERDHLFTLAGRAAPAAAVRGESLDPGLGYVLRDMETTVPACITDDLGNVLAQNWVNAELLGQFAGLPGRGPNLIWRWFTSPPWRQLLEPADQHEATGQFYVAGLRAAVGRLRRHDTTAVTLIRDLRQASPDFERMWDQHTISAAYHTTKQVHDPRVGRIDLDCATVASPLSEQRLLFLQPVAGSRAAERIARLASTK